MGHDLDAPGSHPQDAQHDQPHDAGRAKSWAEFRLHLRAALTNGVTRDEIKEILLQIGAYCGIPACLEAFRIATEVFKEVDGAKGGD